MERLSVDRLKADEKLIEVVKRFPCLWEVHSKSFRDLAAKESAWKVISAEVGYSDEDCLKRWKALRDRFVREAKKVKENMTADGGAGYVPPWSLFEAMMFLQDSIRHRRSVPNLQLKKDSTSFNEDIDLEQSGDGEFLSAGSPTSSLDLNASPSQQPTTKRRKTSLAPRTTTSITNSTPFVVGTLSSTPSDERHKEAPQSQMSQDILKSLKILEETVQEQQKIIDDEDELFGKQVAMVMRRLNNKQKATAKLRIQQVFLDVEFPPEPSNSKDL